MSDTFGDNRYFEKVFNFPEKTINAIDYRKMKKAFELAHELRKFEIELLLKKGNK